MRAQRIALVGPGRWGRLILRDLLQLGCEVVAVAPSAAGRQQALELGASHAVERTSEVGDVAGVVVATPIGVHASTVHDALALGVPVFVEKPLTDDPVATEGLVEAGRDRLFVMDKWRYHPGIRELARIAAERELGDVVGLRTVRLGWGNEHPDDADDIWVLLPHDLSIALEILGHVPTPRAATGVVAGTSAHLVGLLGDDPWLHVEVDGMSIERRRSVQLFAAAGVAWLDSAGADHVGVATTASIGTDDWERRPIGDEMPLLAELRAFLEHLEGGPAPRSSVSEGATVVRAIDALRRLAGLER